jgi:hypothetical protein
MALSKRVAWAAVSAVAGLFASLTGAATSHANIGRIVVVGSPQGGWTLTNWNGKPR